MTESTLRSIVAPLIAVLVMALVLALALHSESAGAQERHSTTDAIVCTSAAHYEGGPKNGSRGELQEP